jgi:zona occludens toxin
VVLVNDAGSLRVEHPSAFQGAGLATVGQVDGQRVMYWSGVPAHQKGRQ